MEDKIAINRDFSQGLVTRWESEFPGLLLEHGVTEEEFETTINRLNELFSEAEDYRCTTCVESLLSCFTLFTYNVLFSSQYMRVSSFNLS